MGRKNIAKWKYITATQFFYIILEIRKIRKGSRGMIQNKFDNRAKVQKEEKLSTPVFDKSNKWENSLISDFTEKCMGLHNFSWQKRFIAYSLHLWKQIWDEKRPSVGIQPINGNLMIVLRNNFDNLYFPESPRKNFQNINEHGNSKNVIERLEVRMVILYKIEWRKGRNKFKCSRTEIEWENRDVNAIVKSVLNQLSLIEN